MQPPISYSLPRSSDAEMLKKSRSFFEWADSRRSVRDFSPESFPKEVLENILQTASTAPSGAHKQPWTFCVVSDPALKREIRLAAEQEEKLSYESRMSEEWLQDLAPLGTTWQKPFLETVPYLVVAFKRVFEWESGGQKHPNYYVAESCGLACGFLIAAIHQAGLATLTHTPSPMGFLSKILNRPDNEKPFLLLPVGYPAEDCRVPDLKRKPLEAISVWM
jgi:iodotyrosine deiodinase